MMSVDLFPGDYWFQLFATSAAHSRIVDRYYSDLFTDDILADMRRHFAERVLWVYFL